MTTDNTEPQANEVAPATPEIQPASTSEEPSKTFSQEEVNKMMNQTKRDVRNQFSDYNDLKDRAAKADELEQAQLTEQQRLEARATDAERVAASAAERVASAMISSEVKVRAGQLGIIDPEAAYLLLDRTNVRYGEGDGVTGVDEALTQLLEDKPYLKGAANRAPNINPQSGEPAPTLRLTEDQREAARLMGMSEENYAKGL